MNDAKRLSVWPAHIGLLLVAVGAIGAGFTVTEVVAVGEVHPATVTVRV